MIVSLVTPMLLQAAWWLPYTIAGLIAVPVSIFFFVRRIERKRQADCGNSGQTRMTMMEMDTCRLQLKNPYQEWTVFILRKDPSRVSQSSQY